MQSITLDLSSRKKGNLIIETDGVYCLPDGQLILSHKRSSSFMSCDDLMRR